MLRLSISVAALLMVPSTSALTGSPPSLESRVAPGAEVTEQGAEASDDFTFARCGHCMTGWHADYQIPVHRFISGGGDGLASEQSAAGGRYVSYASVEHDHIGNYRHSRDDEVGDAEQVTWGGDPEWKYCGSAGCHSSTNVQACGTFHNTPTYGVCLWGDIATDDVVAARAVVLEEAMARPSAGAIEELVTLLPNAVEYNAARRAIQIRDCRGDVFASIPLTDTVRQALAANSASAFFRAL